jgi:hypothetical protein
MGRSLDHAWVLMALKNVYKLKRVNIGFDFDVTLADICLVPQVYNAQRFKCGYESLSANQ